MRKYWPLMVLVGALFYSGCAAIQISQQYANLETETRTSTSFTLQPAPAARRVVWLSITDTTDKQVRDAVDSYTRNTLFSRGIKVVSDPDTKHFRRVQANILYVGRSSKSAIDESFSKGYGGALAGGLIGGGIASASRAGVGGSIIAGTVGSLLGAMIETAIDSSYAAVQYSVVADVQISEYSDKPLRQTERGSANQGDSASLNQSISGDNHWQIYRTRIVATATKVNLNFEEARPILERNLANSIAGHFPQY